MSHDTFLIVEYPRDVSKLLVVVCVPQEVVSQLLRIKF
jgi:hypothetical protein